MMTGLFKRFARPRLRGAGVDLVRYPGRPDPRYPPVLRNTWMGNLGIDLVLDVGANVGQYSSDIRSHGYGGQIISFEPLSSAFAVLAGLARSDARWEVRRTAVGEKAGEATLNIAGNSASSSLLPMMTSHLSAAPTSAYVGSEMVKVQTLDALLLENIAPTEKVWLKMDCQGYELPVLRGATAVLPHVVAIECEMSLIPLYQGEPLVEDVIREIAALGLRPAMFTEAFYDPASGRSLQLNGIFLRDS